MTENGLHHCPNCRAVLITARISRYINERCVSNFWCGERARSRARNARAFFAGGSYSNGEIIVISNGGLPFHQQVLYSTALRKEQVERLMDAPGSGA